MATGIYPHKEDRCPLLLFAQQKSVRARGTRRENDVPLSPTIEMKAENKKGVWGGGLEWFLEGDLDTLGDFSFPPTAIVYCEQNRRE